MKSTRKFEIDLTEQDVKEAVAAWLNGQSLFEGHWSPENVSISMPMEWSGNGMMERLAPVLKVRAETSA